MERPRLVTARHALIILAAALVSLLAGSATASAATTLNVNSTADGPAVAGDCTTPGSTCTLRDAVNAVNTASPADDFTINLPAGHITLTQGELAVTGNEDGHTVTIVGGGARATVIDGGGTTRVFEQQTGSPATGNLALSDLTVTGGAAGATSPSLPGDGGGVLFGGYGTLTLTGVALVGNTATFGGGALDVAFEGPSPASVVITGSTIAGNKVTGGAGNGQGGGMAVFGPLTITNSTVTGNTVGNPGTNEGGGIVAAKSSSDQSTTPEPITLVNTTVAGNSVTGLAPAGIGDFGGGLSGDALPTANNVDVGPFYSQLTARNTIIAGNTVDGSTQDCALNNTLTSDHNLSSDASCGFSDPGSRPGTNPDLGPLANNGGETDTLALLPGSPAINAGTNTGCPPADQRGVTRPQQGVCDIGAFEYVPSADLQLAKSGTPGTVTVGHNLTYTLTVRNNGPDAATGVTVTDTLPGGESLVSAAPSQGTCAATSCALGGLASGATATVTVVARTTATGTPVNTASVRGDQADPNLANNTASVRSAVVPAPPAAPNRRPTVHLAAARCYRAAVVIPVRVTSKAALRAVRVTLDGRLILRTRKRHFTIRIARLSRDRSTLTIVARGGGRSRTVHVTLRRCGTPLAPRFTG